MKAGSVLLIVAVALVAGRETTRAAQADGSSDSGVVPSVQNTGVQAVVSTAFEPTYNGHPLSYWLADIRFDSSALPTPLTDEAKSAVAHIGTNAIPYMLERLRQADRPELEDGIIEAGFWNRHLDRIPIWARNPGWYRNQAYVLNEEGELGFEILGANAEQAVPALMILYEQNISPRSQAAIGRALNAIGPAAQRQALPLFLQSAASSNAVVRRMGILAMFGISQSENQPEMVPVLVNALADNNVLTRTVAAKMLARFGTNAQEAVPALVQLLNDNNRLVRLEAGDALNKIAPKAGPKGGVN